MRIEVRMPMANWLQSPTKASEATVEVPRVKLFGTCAVTYRSRLRKESGGLRGCPVADGAADALAGFRERRVGQPDDVADGLHSPSQPSRSERRRRSFPGHAGGTSPAR